MHDAPRGAAGDLFAMRVGSAVVLLGRIVTVRRMKRTAFFDIRDQSGTAQCSLATPTLDASGLSIGDVVRVAGLRTESRTGATTLEVEELSILSRTSDSGALSEDLRAGGFHRTGRSVRTNRAREILVDNNLRDRLYLRSQVLYRLRERLMFHGFDEFDIPVIVSNKFAGTARLFELRSEDLDGILYLRGSLESHLKQLMVAGFESAYCIGPSFRNESAELHEFLMAEGVSMRMSQQEMLGVLEDIVRYIARSVAGFNQASATRIDELSKPWKIARFGEIVKTDISNDREAGKAYARLRDEFAESFDVPRFVDSFPAAISPLAATDSIDPMVARRGYMFYRGFRICEIVQEQTDADQQLSVFESRRHALEQSAPIDTERMPWSYDTELIEALRLGCPPLAGFGLHINRLIAAISGTDRISEVVPFPLTSGRIAR